MIDICCMNQMKINQSGTVYIFKASNHIKKRLMDIGLYEGAPLQCVLKSPSGNPKAYNINGAIIALRNEDCNDIYLRID